MESFKKVTLAVFTFCLALKLGFIENDFFTCTENQDNLLVVVCFSKMLCFCLILVFFITVKTSGIS